VPQCCIWPSPGWTPRKPSPVRTNTTWSRAVSRKLGYQPDGITRHVIRGAMCVGYVSSGRHGSGIAPSRSASTGSLDHPGLPLLGINVLDRVGRGAPAHLTRPSWCCGVPGCAEVSRLLQRIVVGGQPVATTTVFATKPQVEPHLADTL
jgi:hypothetical protein